MRVGVRWRGVLAWLGFCVVVTGALAVTVGSAGVTGNGEIAFLAAPGSQIALTSSHGIVNPVPQPPLGLVDAWSGDGQHLLLPGNGNVYRFDIATGRFSVLLTTPPGPFAGFKSVAWSRRGELVAARSIDFGSRSRLFVARADGTHRHVIGPRGASRPAWSWDGRWIAFVRNASEIWRMRSDGSELRRVRGPGGPNDTPARLAWSPDGQSIAFTTDVHPKVVRVVDLQNATRRIAAFASAVIGMGWGPARHGLMIAVDGVGAPPTVWRWDGQRLVQIGSLPEGSSAAAFSPLAARVAFNHDGGIEIADADGSNAQLLTMVGADGAPSFSPDGSLVTFARGGRLAVMNADGTNLRLIPIDGTPQAFSATPPSWSPDGTKITISLGTPASKYDPGFAGIAVVAAQGGSLDVVVPADPQPFASYDPEWSPDGSQIAFVKGKIGLNGEDAQGLWLVTPGSQPHQLLPEPVSWFAWSPDSTRIAAVTTAGVTLITVATGESTDLALQAVSTQTTVSWSPDGTRLALTASTSADPQAPVFNDYGLVTIVNADGTGARVLAQNAAFESWSPDGNRLLIRSGGTNESQIISSIALDGTDPEIITTIDAPDAHPAWQPLR